MGMGMGTEHTTQGQDRRQGPNNGNEGGTNNIGMGNEEWGPHTRESSKRWLTTHGTGMARQTGDRI
jgi:hypothetical protein